MGPACVDQRLARLRQLDIDDVGDEDRVGAPVDLLHHRAIERYESVVERRRTGGQAAPRRACELVAIARLHAPGKPVGELRVLSPQHVDAKPSVPLDRRAGRARLMDADQQGRPVG